MPGIWCLSGNVLVMLNNTRVYDFQTFDFITCEHGIGFGKLWWNISVHETLAFICTLINVQYDRFAVHMLFICLAPQKNIAKRNMVP